MRKSADKTNRPKKTGVAKKRSCRFPLRRCLQVLLCAGFLWSLLPLTFGFPVTNGGVWFPALLCAGLFALTLWGGRLSGKVAEQKKAWERPVYCFAVALVLCGVAFSLLLSALMTAACFGDKKQAEQQDCTVLVLGCQVKGERPSASLKYRLDAALEFCETHPGVPVIVSGGRGDNEEVTEASVMREYLIRHGLDKAQVIAEEESLDTAENLTACRRIIKDRGLSERIVLVTSFYHQYRAGQRAHRAGFGTVIPCPAASVPALWLQSWTREWLGICELWFLG